LFAQVSIKLNSNSGYTSNSFPNYKDQPDYYSTLNALVGNDWIGGDTGTRLYYKGAVYSYKNYSERTYQKHGFGLDWYRYINEENNKFNVGLDWEKRFQHETYKWYEGNEFSAYLQLKLVLTPSLFSYYGLNFQQQNFDNLEAFSNWTSTAFIRLSRFFNTGTTVILEGNYLSKTYTPAGKENQALDFAEIVTVGDGSSQQAVGLIRLAQSLGTTTGLSIQGLIRHNTTNSVRYLGNSYGYYYSDEEIFDDPFGYDSQELQISLKSYLPWQIKVSFGSALILKHYHSRFAMDLNGDILDENTLRDDQRYNAWMGLQKSIGVSKGLLPLTLALNYYFIQNNSNDPYYDYNSGFFSFGISTGL
jgi:hypothetical protein